MAQAERIVAAAQRPEIQHLGSKDLSLVKRGTQVASPQGEVPVEDLSIGEAVVSRSKGAAPVRRIGTLWAMDRAVKVPAGALGRNVPLRDCWLAPNTQVWMRSSEFEASFSAREVMVCVKDLIGWQGITAAASQQVITEYFLILCDTPQILTMDGLQVEMRHPGNDMPLFDAVMTDSKAIPFPELVTLTSRAEA